MSCAPRFHTRAAPLAAALVLALTLGAPLAVTRAQAQPAFGCDAAAFARLDLPSTRIVSAERAEAGDDAGAHCALRGVVNEREGSDGKRYAIGFEMRLPDRWNGGYFHQANGGNDGIVVPAYGNLGGRQPDTALARGYAVLSTDAGHDARANRRAGLIGGNLFGFDLQARLDYGYAANVTLTPLAKTVIERYYGRRPQRSYMVGCSNGGRHALVGATRLAREFDGFLAGAPGYDLPRVSLQHAWDIQSFSQVNADVRLAFSPDDMQTVADGVLEQCDALDGAADGIVAAIAQCQQTFALERLTCGTSSRRAGACLAPQQVAALARSFAGPSDSRGRRLYASWPFDAGVSAEDWRGWKLESTAPGHRGWPLIMTLGGGTLAQVFLTPPTVVAGTPRMLFDFLHEFDFDRDAPKILATTSAYPVSAMDFMAPTDWRNPRLAELQAAGGKVIVYHGASDGAFSLQATIDWYEKVRANNGGDASAFARFYPVPGMTHCGGGPSTDRFAAFDALVAWVERGEAPGDLIATVRGNNALLPFSWSNHRTRPLCDWPKVARYRGKGDIESAASFTCQ